MNERIKALAEKAGFVFWGDEAWGPGPGNIDWSCEYGDAMEKFVKLLEQENIFKDSPEQRETYIADVEEDEETGETYIKFPQEMLDKMNWREGDTINWNDNNDGTFTLTKKEVNTELVLVECVSTFRMRYVVEVPAGKAEWALDTVAMNEAKEFSQHHLDETIVSHRVVSQEEVLKLCDADNEYLSSWTDEAKLNTFVTKIDEE